MGVKLFVNNEQVWESEGDATLVNYVSGQTRRGEFGRLGVANDIDRIDLLIGVRDEIESASDLDVRDALEGRERSEKIEKALNDRGEREGGMDANRLANESLEEGRVPNENDNTESHDAGSEGAGNSTTAGTELGGSEVNKLNENLEPVSPQGTKVESEYPTETTPNPEISTGSSTSKLRNR